METAVIAWTVAAAKRCRESGNLNKHEANFHCCFSFFAPTGGCVNKSGCIQQAMEIKLNWAKWRKKIEGRKERDLGDEACFFIAGRGKKRVKTETLFEIENVNKKEGKLILSVKFTTLIFFHDSV